MLYVPGKYQARGRSSVGPQKACPAHERQPGVKRRAPSPTQAEWGLRCVSTDGMAGILTRHPKTQRPPGVSTPEKDLW